MSLVGLPPEFAVGIAAKRDRLRDQIRRKIAIADQAEDAVETIMVGVDSRDPNVIEAVLVSIGDQEALAEWRRAMEEHAAIEQASRDAESAYQQRVQEFHTREKRRQDMQVELGKLHREVASHEDKRAAMERLAAEVEHWGKEAETLRSRIVEMAESPDLPAVITRSVERQIRNADGGHAPA